MVEREDFRKAVAFRIVEEGVRNRKEVGSHKEHSGSVRWRMGVGVLRIVQRREEEQ